MSGMRKFRSGILAAALGVLTMSSSSYAAPVPSLPVLINAGDLNTNLGRLLPSGLTLLADSGQQNFTNSLSSLLGQFKDTDFVGMIDSQVFRTSTGTLTFIYTITSTSATRHGLDEVDFAGLGKYKIAVGEGGAPSINTFPNGSAQDHAERPTTPTDLLGDSIDFHYHGFFDPGQITSFVLQTDATNYAVGSQNMTMVAENAAWLADDVVGSGDFMADDSNLSLSVFQPVGAPAGPVPLPSGALAGLLGLTTLGIVVRRKVQIC